MKTSAYEEYLNQKYGAFWVTRHDFNTHRSVGIGKSYPTIAEAMVALRRLQKIKRHPEQILMVDIKP